MNDPYNGLAAPGWAQRVHKDQKYGAHPYYYHLSAVNRVLSDFGFGITSNIIAAGWLHDTLEDTDTTPEQIEDAFGKEVLKYVEAVTGRGKDRKEKFEGVYKKLAAFPEAIPLKLADRIANTEECKKNYNKKLLDMYREEYAAFFSHLYGVGFSLNSNNRAVRQMWERLALATW